MPTVIPDGMTVFDWIEQNYMDTPSIARYLGINHDTVKRLIRQQQFPAHLWRNHAYFALRDDVERFKQQYTGKPGPNVLKKQYTWEGKTMTVFQWEEHLQLSRDSIRKRIDKGYSFRDAVAAAKAARS